MIAKRNMLLEVSFTLKKYNFLSSSNYLLPEVSQLSMEVYDGFVIYAGIFSVFSLLRSYSCCYIWTMSSSMKLPFLC